MVERAQKRDEVDGGEPALKQQAHQPEISEIGVHGRGVTEKGREHAEHRKQPCRGRGSGANEWNVRHVKGVQLRANGEIWPGIRDVENYVTPVHVSFFNGSKYPISVAYDDFWLIDSKGHRYAALPPFRIEGTVVSQTYGEVHPAFTYSEFEHVSESVGRVDLRVTVIDSATRRFLGTATIPFQAK